MLDSVTAPKTSKPRGAKAPKTSEAEGRRKNRLAQHGDEAARLAKRQLLLTTAEACDWNLARVAEIFEMTSTSDVLRAFKELDLETELDAARERGDVAPGRREK